LDDIRAQRIPVDLLELFDTEQVPFYEGLSKATIHPQHY
jgi:transcription factor SPT20